MDAQELRNLSEAYLEVYQVDEATAMAKRGLDEPAIRQQIAKSTGGGEAADRATALEKKPTFGDANKAKQRQNYARAQRGDFRSTTSSSPGLHGYAHKSDDPTVKAKQAARGAQRSALTPAEKKQLNREEFDLYDIILSHLLDEGYADTEKAAQIIMTNMSEEWRDSIVEGFKPIGKDTENRMYRRAGNLARTSIASNNPKEKIATAKKSAKIVSTIVRQKEKDRFDSIGQDPKHN